MSTTLNQTLGEAARARFTTKKPLLFSDWRRALFIHYEVDPEVLQYQIPYVLDLWEGRAYVSLVAFSMRNLRPRWGGKMTACFFQPIANHKFLNVRTYVWHGGRTGIYFMEEFLNNRLSIFLGPRSYGLPYHYGEIEYHHQPEEGLMHGKVASKGRKLIYQGVLPEAPKFSCCAPGTLDEFLLERYTAFTHHRGTNRFFDIWHVPWPQIAIPVTMTDDGLLHQTGQWLKSAKLIGANYSPGVGDIWMGGPAFV